MKFLKYLAPVVLVACGIGSAQAAGDCSVLVGYIQAAKVWQANGMSRDGVPSAIARTLARTNAIRAASDEERSQWNELAIEIFDGRRFTDKQLEHALGRFCKYPFKLTLIDALGEEAHRRGQKAESRAQSAPDDEVAQTPVDPPGYYDKGSMCTSFGRLFTSAAVQRDDGNSPEYAFKWIMQIQQPRAGGQFSIDKSQVKTAINLVYFDPDFSQIGPGHLLSGAIFRRCMNDWKTTQYQPLQ